MTATKSRYRGLSVRDEVSGDKKGRILNLDLTCPTAPLTVGGLEIIVTHNSQLTKHFELLTNDDHKRSEPCPFLLTSLGTGFVKSRQRRDHKYNQNAGHTGRREEERVEDDIVEMAHWAVSSSMAASRSRVELWRGSGC